MSPRNETISNHRITVLLLGSGYGAVHLVDVTDELGTYTDIQQTGFGRYKAREPAVKEAIDWSNLDQIPLAPDVKAPEE